MHCAMVNVFPDPVTPSSTWDLSPRFNPSTSSSMARAWSPPSSKAGTSLNWSYLEAISVTGSHPHRARTRRGEVADQSSYHGRVVRLAGRVGSGGEVSRAGPNLCTPQVGPLQLDFDRTPG